MFGKQSKADKEAAAAEAAALEAAAAEAAAGSTRTWGKPQVEIIRTWARPRVDQGVVAARGGIGSARTWAQPHVDRGIGAAAPRLGTAVQGLGPVVDKSRDKIVEDLLPRLSELITTLAASSTAARDEAVDRTTGAASVLSGESEAIPKGGGLKRVLGILALLSGVVAAVFAVVQQRKAGDDDPWATPLSDPYAAPAAADIAPVPTDAGVLDSTDALDSFGTIERPDTPGAADLEGGDLSASGAETSADLASLDGLMSVSDDPDEITVIDAVPGDDANTPATDDSGAHHEEGEHRF